MTVVFKVLEYTSAAGTSTTKLIARWINLDHILLSIIICSKYLIFFWQDITSMANMFNFFTNTRRDTFKNDGNLYVWIFSQIANIYHVYLRTSMIVFNSRIYFRVYVIPRRRLNVGSVHRCNEQRGGRVSSEEFITRENSIPFRTRSWEIFHILRNASSSSSSSRQY